MSETKPPTPVPAKPRRSRLAAGLALATAALIVAMVLLYYYYYPSQLGPVQPVSFSHQVHAGVKQISCVFCHTGVIDTDRAGVPAVEKCMLCHQRILITYPEVEKLRRYYDEKKPPQWVRVNSLPEFVYFSHERHIRSGADCGQCHGNIRGMDRVYLVQDFTMGFCVQCHRDNNYSHDCYTCHR